MVDHARDEKHSIDVEKDAASRTESVVSLRDEETTGFFSHPRFKALLTWGVEERGLSFLPQHVGLHLTLTLTPRYCPRSG